MNVQEILLSETIANEILTTIESELNNLIIEESLTENNNNETQTNKKRTTIKDLYETLITQNPELAKVEFPVIGKFTYEKFKKLI